MDFIVIFQKEGLNGGVEVILCVSLTRVPSRWSDIILGVSVRVFLDEVNI